MYDYEKFLSDSSDDYPKYADGIVVPDPVQQKIRQQQVDIKEGLIRQSLGNPLPKEPVDMMDPNRPWLDYDWSQVKTAEDMNDVRAAIDQHKKDYRAWLDSNDIYTGSGKLYSEAMKNANELERHRYCKKWYIRICRILKRKGIL